MAALPAKGPRLQNEVNPLRQACPLSLPASLGRYLVVGSPGSVVLQFEVNPIAW
jgi:hypothetical protein